MGTLMTYPILVVKSDMDTSKSTGQYWCLTEAEREEGPQTFGLTPWRY